MSTFLIGGPGDQALERSVRPFPESRRIAAVDKYSIPVH